MISINLHQAGKLNITLEFPSCWNDLFPEEVLFISKTLLLQDEENDLETRPQLLKYFIEYRAKITKQKLPANWLALIDHEQAVLDGYPLLDFIFTENDLTKLPEKIRIPGVFTNQFLHAGSFDKITCGEYEDCELKTGEFIAESSGELLAGLAAILFRPLNNLRPFSTRGEGVGVEAYMTFNPRTNSYYTYQSEKKVSKFLKLPPEQLYAIFIWFTGCRNQLPKIFPTVYEGSGGEPDIMAFTKCIHSGAGVKNGSREKIRTMKLYEFMYEMEQEAIKSKELQAEYDRISNK